MMKLRNSFILTGFLLAVLSITFFSFSMTPVKADGTFADILQADDGSGICAGNRGSFLDNPPPYPAACGTGPLIACTSGANNWNTCVNTGCSCTCKQIGVDRASAKWQWVCKACTTILCNPKTGIC